MVTSVAVGGRDEPLDTKQCEEFFFFLFLNAINGRSQPLLLPFAAIFEAGGQFCGVLRQKTTTMIIDLRSSRMLNRDLQSQLTFACIVYE